MDSDPQIPTSLGLVTTQSGRRNPGSSMSMSRVGVRASIRNKRLSVSPMGCTSGSTPYMSARMADIVGLRRPVVPART